MKYFVVADVHSFYDIMIQALDEAGFDRNNPDHCLISLGDLLDRGNQSLECLNFINSLERKILLKGNHEDLMKEMLDRGYAMMHDFHNMTTDSAIQIAKMRKKDLLTPFSYQTVIDAVKENDAWNTYYNNLIDYHTVGSYIFVHGWIPCIGNHEKGYIHLDKPWTDASEEQWKSARWANGMLAAYDGVYVEGKQIVCGHWNVSWGHKTLGDSMNKTKCGLESLCYEPYVTDKIIALDACTVVSKKINVFVFEHNE